MNPEAALLIAERDAATHFEKAREVYDKAQAHVLRLTLASIIVAHKVPAGSAIEALPFDDEPNADGTFDIAFAEVTDIDGAPLDDIMLSSVEAVPAGLPGGDTVWGDFMHEGSWCIEVDRVYAWLDRAAIVGPERADEA